MLVRTVVSSKGLFSFILSNADFAVFEIFW